MSKCIENRGVLWPLCQLFPLPLFAPLPFLPLLKKTHPEARFKSEYGKPLTIHSLTLYLNKIKMLALSFTIEACAIHHISNLITVALEHGVIGSSRQWGAL